MLLHSRFVSHFHFVRARAEDEEGYDASRYRSPEQEFQMNEVEKYVRRKSEQKLRKQKEREQEREQEQEHQVEEKKSELRGGGTRGRRSSSIDERLEQQRGAQGGERQMLETQGAEDIIDGQPGEGGALLIGGQKIVV